ncbi:hypothetical protein ESCO_001791 [Escovopsis weberi]|uniref:Uncharacterized protein n=1 Tax=Escovopsis weberi TaxID=150374 RepID=A0A0M8MYL9_ESCWE|nr:hypothetical protein ESCO_001791 [Escovopsis weberi]
MQSDDPETRANRIRSFYKEYFDESKQPAPPMPAPSQPSQKTEPAKQPTTLADYLADDDDDYLGDAAYYDASTNTFIMPYAQPVTRRAMTPPPANRTRDGPAPGGPPRGPHAPQGSVSGASLPGATRPRAGSAHDLRPGSSASARWNRGPPQKKLPPPSPLNTLPTPGKLKDDSFAIMGSIDHMLRKSTAFTALDFAPPKKFKESGDTGASETGSLRSVRSGISAVQLNAIRSGAGRVSRLPGDTVFTQAAMDDQLKPQWGMRP